ncbi:hypothetical protein UFOVP671_22 [uncultured Caudovirales phage]|uniref:Uncharacterized protein n=1 Tax=uncultured Caudovirales phage TaxID=2100421 RepID=A0A6J5N7U7_9CAUD|nr:hypothetical protein UFOVP671_22 [uncultured Caudovirales phage]
MAKFRETRIRVGIEIHKNESGYFAPGFKTIEDYLDSLGDKWVSQYWALGFAEDDIHNGVLDLLNSGAMTTEIGYQSPNTTHFRNIWVSDFTDKLRYTGTCKYLENAQERKKDIEFLVTILPSK